MKIQYQVKNFRSRSRRIIELADQIIQEYTVQGFTLTLRQLYYQFVSRDYIPNNQTEYDKLGAIINDARLAGLIDWDAIEDRTRNLRSMATWNSPSEIIRDAALAYIRDYWRNQSYRVEVWIEKDALVGVIERICHEYQVPYFSCRGYVSQSEMHSAARRIGDRYDAEGVPTIILHLGDHDPSGIDMTRDIRDRLAGLYFGLVEVSPNYPSSDPTDFRSDYRDMSHFQVRRIALNMDQIRSLNPPPNPAKITDSRATEYIRNYGRSSWELDALDPNYLQKLISDHITDIIEMDKWNAEKDQSNQERRFMGMIGDRFTEITDYLEQNPNT